MTENRGAPRQPLVLVVDDDPNVRLLATEALSHAGLRVVEAASGLEALTVVQSLGPDLVLLDVLMPEMDGFEVCARLRETQVGRHLGGAVHEQQDVR